jgi:predicted anti-sigma-YlaC factor YlaD
MSVVKSVIPARCERSREWASLRLDDMLSMFESALLDRHLRRCAGCRAFADATQEQTELLRQARLETPARTIVVPERRTSRRRRAAIGTALVAAVSSAAAAFTLAPDLHHATRGTRVGVRDQNPVMVVVPASPTPNSKVEIPRLKVEPASIADGPLRGAYFNRPSV